MHPNRTKWVLAVVFIALFAVSAQQSAAQELRERISEAFFDGNTKEAMRLVKQLPDINSGTKDFPPPIFDAVTSDNLKCVKAMVEAGASVNVREKKWNMPLLNEVAAIGSEEIFDYLLAKGAKHDQLDKYGGNALEEAACCGHYEIATKLMKLGLKTKYPLHVACGLGDVRAVKIMIAGGAKVNEQTGWKNTPLVFAAMAKQPKTMKLLLDAKADTELTNVFGSTAMHYAAVGDDPALVTELIA
ncbi:MAG: ankyrin repeat domain-containing protein, partial [Planctomycetota bacterium]